MMLLLLLAIVGAYATAWWLLENLIIPAATITWSSLRLSASRKKSLAQRYGKWAVITGATDGIGKGFAQQLANKGMNLVLISRSEAKLNKVSQEIRIAAGVEVKTIVADFSHGEPIYENIRKQLESIDIGMLVNNVGVMGRLDAFETLSQQHHLQIVNVNVLSVLLMTHVVLPKMKKAGRGIIINISSGLAVFPGPYVASYSASKSFGHSFTLALQEELRGSGVECQLVVPGFVRTNMIKNLSFKNIGGRLLPDVHQFCASATWLIGKTNQTAGHWYQGLWNVLSNLVPFSIRKRVTGLIFKYLLAGQTDKVKRTSL